MRTKVAVLAATGMVSQRYVSILARHPYFELTAVTGHESVGMRYNEALRSSQKQSIFGSVTRQGVNVRMISQGSSELSVSFVVSDEDAGKTVSALHADLISRGK